MKAKRCTRCGVEKGARGFSPRGKGFSSWCRECHRAWGREQYATDPERRRAVAKRGEVCRRMVQTDVVVLDFDHVRGNKVRDVSKLAVRAVAPAKLLAEIAKCEVRCVNCHRRKTHFERRTWRSHLNTTSPPKRAR